VVKLSEKHRKSRTNVLHATHLRNNNVACNTLSNTKDPYLVIKTELVLSNNLLREKSNNYSCKNKKLKLKNWRKTRGKNRSFE